MIPPPVGSIVEWRGERWLVTGPCAGWRRTARDMVRVLSHRGVRDIVPLDTFEAGGASVVASDPGHGRRSVWRLP